MSLHGVLHQRPLARASHPPQYSHAQRNALAHGVRGRTCFCFDFDFLRAIVKQADADMIETKVLLDLSHDLAQHLHRVVAGDGSTGNVIEKRELAGTPLLVGKQPRILNCHRDLTRRRDQALPDRAVQTRAPAPGVIATMTPAGLLPNKIGAATKHLAGCSGICVTPNLLLIFSRSARINSGWPVVIRFAECIFQLARSLGENAIALYFQLEANLVALLEGDIEIAGVENLSRFV